MARQRRVIGKNIFWIASIAVVVLLAFHILSFTQVTQFTANDLGLLTKLPLTFWIGLAYLLILLYLGRKSGRKTVIVVVLISFYLVAIPVLIEQNKAEGLGISYYFATQGTDLLSGDYLKLGSLDVWDLRNWPGFFIVTAIISSATGLSATTLADYFPLLTMALLEITIFMILRLKLNIIYSSLGALWFVASFWTGQHYYSPQSFAYLMFFAVFLFLAKFFLRTTKNISLQLCFVLLFTATVITHLLTSFFILFSIIALFLVFKILRQRFSLSSLFFINIILLLASIFFVYQALVIPNAFSNLVSLLAEQISSSETHLATIVTGRSTAGSTPLTLQIMGTYSLTIVNAIIAVLATAATGIAVFLRKKKWTNELFWIAWIIAAAVLGLTVKYGAEALNRAIMFLLIPACYFAMKFLSKKPRILIVFLMILIVLFFPARYCSENYVYASTTELEGVSFYLYHAPSNATFLSEFLVPFGPPLGPQITGEMLSITNVVGLRLIPNSNEVNYLIGQAQYIVYSNELRNYYAYFYGVDLIENFSSNAQHTLLYDNGDLKVYSQISAD
jgi:hypothetical protein